MSALILDRAAGPSLLIEGDRIASGNPPRGARRIDCAAAAIAPGAVNAHTHLYSGLVPLGMPAPARPPRTFLEILQRVWWRLDRALDAASLRAAARLYLAEALLAGTTALFDHHESPRFIDGSLDVIADAAQELGIRLAVAYGATERNGGADEARRGLAECRRFWRANRRPLVRGLVGLHASFTVSDETIREAGELAREMGAKVHLHVAEDLCDVLDARQRGFDGPLERLLELAGLPRGSVLAHGVHLDRAQVQRARAAGLWLVQNPRSNENNRVGYPRALLAASEVALGTDGYPADMDDERRALFRLALENGDEEASLEARVRGGRRLCSALFGCDLPDTPVAGSAADLVVREPGGPPRHVVVAGELVVEDGRLVRGDLEEIRARAREEAARLFRRMEEIA